MNIGIIDIIKDIENLCNNIYFSIGPSHSEKVYQEILSLELGLYGKSKNLNTVVQTEYHVPIYFKCCDNIERRFGDERVDILVSFNELNIVIELKAIKTCNELDKCQLKKYKTSLEKIGINVNATVLINFQKSDTGNVIFIKEF